ncbi:alkene reductase [Nocardia brasiliensis]|uniref:Alkene reductase n=1 Tax=Nocardia brasiliensis TaxID=37326 RepID=A0A6G9XTV3_NOCBR|nr:alkene reductase [Nocardia brasiliensis]QIS04349.1 alkene reductase [Nocardia brasiliensis]
MKDQPSFLFEPVTLGALRLANRMVMAPMTRSRALPDGQPHPAAATYYAQRASAGLVVSEGIAISPQGIGNPSVPGLWTNAQAQAWQTVTKAVHQAGGLIVAQLWHTGRASHSSLQPDNESPVGPSAIAINGMTFARHGRVRYETPRALRTEEIPGIVEQYRQAAGHALTAGFDGVELHGANGYLIDQFLQNSANQRGDRYGGPVINRTRLLRETLHALVSIFGPDRVGVRLSPASTFQDMTDSDPIGLFTHVFTQLTPLNLAYVHVVEPGVIGADSAPRPADAIDSRWVVQHYPHTVIAAGNYDKASAEQALSAGVSAVAFGRSFLANPDLPRRFALDAALNSPDRETFYQGGERGYIDYPSLAAENH